MRVSGRLRRTLKRVLPAPLLRMLRRRRGGSVDPPLGRVRFGDLRRTDPIARDWGYSRNGPVDRYYIEGFLEAHRRDIRGHVLEVGDDSYTRQFGGTAVETSDVLHVDPAAPGVTIVGDLADQRCLPRDTFDCIVLTQTLHLIFEANTALDNIHRSLKPGGVLLLTVPGISPIDAGEWGSTWYYAFTQHSLTRMAARLEPEAHVAIGSHGNVLSAVAFLHGLGAEELTSDELEQREPTHSIVHTLRLQRAESEATAPPG